MVSSAQILTGFLDSIPRADIESALTPTEIGSIAKLALTFLIGMDSFYPSLVLLRASSDVLSRIREEAIAEWSKTDNSPSIYRAIDSLETFMIALKTGTGSGNLLHNHLPSGLFAIVLVTLVLLSLLALSPPLFPTQTSSISFT